MVLQERKYTSPTEILIYPELTTNYTVIWTLGEALVLPCQINQISGKELTNNCFIIPVQNVDFADNKR